MEDMQGQGQGKSEADVTGNKCPRRRQAWASLGQVRGDLAHATTPISALTTFRNTLEGNLPNFSGESPRAYFHYFFQQPHFFTKIVGEPRFSPLIVVPVTTFEAHSAMSGESARK